MKTHLDVHTAVHDTVGGFGRITSGGIKLPRHAHSVTGHKAIYVNKGFTTHSETVSADESKALLDNLKVHIQRPTFWCRFRSRPVPIAFWDKRSVQHSAVYKYFPATPLRFRVQVRGDRPV